MLQKPPTKDGDGMGKNARELFYLSPSICVLILGTSTYIKKHIIANLGVVKACLPGIAW